MVPVVVAVVLREVLLAVRQSGFQRLLVVVTVEYSTLEARHLPVQVSE